MSKANLKSKREVNKTLRGHCPQTPKAHQEHGLNGQIIEQMVLALKYGSAQLSLVLKTALKRIVRKKPGLDLRAIQLSFNFLGEAKPGQFSAAIKRALALL